ncbi:hypothetical protein PRIPAC_75807 [Pristionchus pacificus]|uniref:Uncharacterized protein n=1 Tax=Pristionchus pacificus TaxID=54126 RepID=A0A2A6CFU7_PRIPA|nr:hypothetical protein PRIPAC_75807 [Pristionchus pacificus]|eukprot:PDM76958.1 hypothetical protein PRIPAC_42353 [Pristionchus pacificus]
MIYLLPLLATVTLACGPAGSGSDAQLLQNPTFTFDFSPPIGWTFFTTAAAHPTIANSVAYSGQSASLADANRRIQNDLDNAILKALNTLRVQAFGVQYALSGYTPEDIVIRSKLKIIDMAVRVKNPLDVPQQMLVGSYVPDFGAVTFLRTVAEVNSGTPYRFKGTVRVGNAPLATRGQWKNIANEVYKNMMINARVKFYTPITVM